MTFTWLDSVWREAIAPEAVLTVSQWSALPPGKRTSQRGQRKLAVTTSSRALPMSVMGH